MANKVEDLVNVILDSYNECDITARIDEENMLNKDILIEIIDEIRKVLFPGFFDNNKVRSEYLKFLVGERLEFIQYHLKKQVSNAFANQDVCRECSKAQAEEKAEEVVFEFLKKIPKIREYLNTDIQAAYDGDPAAYSTDEIIFCYPGVFAITVYRIAHELWLLGVPMIPRIMTEYAHSTTGIDIHPGATVGKYFFIDHGTGIVIGETTEIGDNVKIWGRIQSRTYQKRINEEETITKTAYEVSINRMELIEKEENGYYIGLTNEYIHGRVKSDGQHSIGDLIGGTVVAVEKDFVIIE